MRFIPTGSPNTVIQLIDAPGAAKLLAEDGHNCCHLGNSGGITNLKVYPFKVSVVPRSPASSSSATWRSCVRALLRQLKACPRCRAAGQDSPLTVLPRNARVSKLPRSSDCDSNNNNVECNASAQLSRRDSDDGCCAAQDSQSSTHGHEVMEEYDLVSIDPTCPRHGKYSLTAWLRKHSESAKEPPKDSDTAAAAAVAELEKKVPAPSLRGARRHIRKLLPTEKDTLSNLSGNARSGRVINRLRSPTIDSEAAAVDRHCIERIKPAAKQFNGNLDVRRKRCSGETYASQYRRMCHFKARVNDTHRRFFQTCNAICGGASCDREATEGILPFEHEDRDGSANPRDLAYRDENTGSLESISSTPTWFFTEEQAGRGDGVSDLKKLERRGEAWVEHHEEPLAYTKGLVLDCRVGDTPRGGAGGAPSIILEGFSGVVEEICGAQRLRCGEAQEGDGLVFCKCARVGLIEEEGEVLSTSTSFGSMIVGDEGVQVLSTTTSVGSTIVGGEEVTRDMFDLKEGEQIINFRHGFVHKEDHANLEENGSTRIEVLGDHEVSTSRLSGKFTMLQEHQMGSEIILETKEVFKGENATNLDNERRAIKHILVGDEPYISTQTRFTIEEQQMAKCDIFDKVEQEQDISENLDNENTVVKQLVGDKPSMSTLERFVMIEHQQLESNIFDMTELNQTSQRLDTIANRAKALQMGLKGLDFHRDAFTPIEEVHLTNVEVVQRKEEQDYWLCNMAIERARDRILETCDGGRVCQLVQAFESIK